MSTSNPTSPAAEKVTLPKFQLDYASSARAKCKNCSQSIDKGTLRLGITASFKGKDTYAYRHWGCIKPEEILELKKLDLNEIAKFNELHEDDKVRLTKAIEEGSISEEDRMNQMNKNENATSGQKEKEKGKRKEKEQEKEQEKPDEPEKRERKKSNKRKEIEDQQKQDTETEPKAKKKKTEQALPKTVAPTKDRKSPRKSKTSTEVVPDSEDEGPTALKKPAGKPVKKPGTDKEDKSKSKEKSGPKKTKDTASTSSPVKGDDTMDVDDDEAQEVADALKAKSQTKETETEKQPGVKPPKKAKKAANDDTKASPTSKATQKDPPKALSKATAVQTPAKESVQTAPASKATKSKPANTKADKLTKPTPKAVTSDAEAESSDRGPSTPQTHNPIYLNLSDLFTKPGGPVAASADTSLNLTTPRPRPPPRVTLVKFCKQYKLSSSLQEKLAALDVDGPHVLRLIKDSALESKGFSIGELAGLRDAEERWMADNSN